MRRMEKIFKALGDRNRLRILKMLEVRPLCVCEITRILGLGQSSVSRHLGILRDAGLVIDEKDGLWVNYSLSADGADLSSDLLAGLRRWGNDDPRIAADRTAAGRVNRDEICRPAPAA